MTKEDIDSLVARERPGWRVAEVTEVSDESGTSYMVAIESGSQRQTIMVAEDGTIAGEQE